MHLFETYLQKNASYLFDDYHKNMDKWDKYVFMEILDDNNVKKIRGGDEILYVLKEIKEILKNMIDELVEYNENGEESYMIFDMGGYYIDHDRCWIFEYEIDDFLDVIEKKLSEYKILLEEIDKYNAKIQIDNDVLLGITIAIMKM
jgi:hypothetical protein